MIRHEWLLLSLLLIWSAASGAAETILSYHSDIRIRHDGSMRVTETIKVQAEGIKIRRGIYRDFPTQYKDRHLNSYKVGFDVERVRHNGAATAWHSKHLGNGVRIYIGDAKQRINKGVHRYEITYTTNRQLGFFQDFDELYWNVTGSHWDFPIKQASARVHLPARVDAQDLRLTGYTGPRGSTNRELQWRKEIDGGHFVTTGPLPRHHGLTIVIGWPKGIITPPTGQQRAKWLLKDNLNLLAGVTGLALLLAYYLYAWFKVGKDPEAGAIYPTYAPPKGYSSAAMRYIKRMGYDHQTFTSAIVSLAVKGFLEILETDKKYTLRKLKDAEKAHMAAGEQTLYRKLFSYRDEVVLDRKDHAFLQTVLAAHEASLKKNYKKVLFNTNSVWLVGGIPISILCVVLMAFLLDDPDRLVFTPVLGIFAGIFAATMIPQIRRLLQYGISRNPMRLFTLVIQSAVLGFFIFNMEDVFELVHWPTVTIVVLLILFNYLFYEWLKAPTPAGRRLLNRIDGFALYIGVAEEDQLKLNNPPKITPERFENLLPYAIALGMEDIWGEKFAHAINMGAADSHYSPHWYSGRDFNSHNMSGFSSAMSNSVSSAIASSSTAPGSSSGGSGGSSGGGGGGGGGGGW